MSLASQQPSAHSLMHLTTSTFHCFCILQILLPLRQRFLKTILFVVFLPRRGPGTTWYSVTHAIFRGICQHHLWLQFFFWFYIHVLQTTMFFYSTHMDIVWVEGQYLWMCRCVLWFSNFHQFARGFGVVIVPREGEQANSEEREKHPSSNYKIPARGWAS